MYNTIDQKVAGLFLKNSEYLHQHEIKYYITLSGWELLSNNILFLGM